MNLNNLDFNKLRIFYSVVHYGNYQKASLELGLTRSAISQSITTLEAQLGVALFLRKGKKLYPTQSAQELAKEFGHCYQALEQSIKKITGHEGEVEGVVRIGSYYEFSKNRLSPLIKEFLELYPKVQIKFVFDSPSKLEKHLAQGRIDLCFSIFPYRGLKEISSRKVLEQELVLIAPEKFSRKARTLEGLLELPLIEYYPSHHILPKWIYKNFGKRVRNLKPSVYAASAEMLFSLAEQGVGVGVLPRYICESKPSKQTKIVRLTDKKLIDYIWLHQHSGQFENSAHREFYHFVCENSVFHKNC